MTEAELEEFFKVNARLYAGASAEDLEQLRKISALYPGQARLLPEAEAVDAAGFACQRCGACCSAVRYVPVCHGDVLRWLGQERWDILDRLAIDRRRTPLMAVWGREAVAAARDRAQLAAGSAPEDRRDRLTELLYVTDLVECAVYAGREDNRCAFFAQDGSVCGIHDTKPRVCDKFPFYAGRYTDARLLQRDFCPGLKALAKK